jgi:hypothetical protein
MLAGHIQVSLDLARDQLVAAGLDLDQSGPGPLPGHHLKQAIGPQLLLPVGERDLDVGRQPAGRCAHRDRYRAAEFPHRLHHGQKRRSCPAFLLIGAADTGHREQPGTFPLHLAHIHSPRRGICSN